MGDVTREKDPLLQAKREGGSIAVVFTVSLRNIHQLTVKGVVDRRRYLSNNKLCLTVLALGIERQNADALLLARRVMGSTIVRFVISFQTR